MLLEGLMLSVAGTTLGLILGHVVAAAGTWLMREHQLYLIGLACVAEEAWLLIPAFAVGMVAALLPVDQACRIDISKVLAKR